MIDRSSRIDGLCRYALEGGSLRESELRALLEARGDEAEVVYAAAREVRARHWGDSVFLYGFVYFSTYCRNGCSFCLYRSGNKASPRYRKSLDEVVAVCRGLAASGVVLVDLTMGEDPQIHDEPGYAGLLELVGAVNDAVGLPVMISPGLVPDDVLDRLRRYGAEWYALYQEVHTPALYRHLRVGQPFAARAGARRAARQAGLLVEDGLLTGVGDTIWDRAHSIAAMRRSGCEQVRVMSFMPQQGTPLATAARPRDEVELLTIAVMRLAMPKRLIPASLDVGGLEGLDRRLQAGANVVTSIVPPSSGLLGVSQARLGIEEGLRTVASIEPHLRSLGLRPGSVQEYRERLAALRGRGARVAS